MMTQAPTAAKPYLVSAIVSTYKSERFMRGCLEDLEAQTIADQMEIIVIDSNSPENERAIVKEFQQRYDNIVYIRTEERDSVYAAWNRGIKIARGKYISNANTDDRHSRDAFERMAAVLENRPDIALVYANVFVTITENETFERHSRIGASRYPDFNSLKLIYRNFIGPQPMWRKSMHTKYGYFDESFESAGDTEFWLRMAGTETFFHLDEFLGLYLKSPMSIEHRNRELSRREVLRVQQRYLHRLGFQNAVPSVSSVPGTDSAGQGSTPVSSIIGFNDLQVGQRLKVKGKLGDGAALVSLAISVKTPAEEAGIEGFVQSLDHQKNTLCLLNREFALMDCIEIKGLQDLKVGDRVKLKGKYSALKGFVPERIKKTETMGLSIEKLQGNINKIDREKKILDVLGFTVIVDDDTLIF